MSFSRTYFRFSLRFFLFATICAGVGLGLLGRVPLLPKDESFDQRFLPRSGLILQYDPQYGYIRLHYDESGQLVYTPYRLGATYRKSLVKAHLGRLPLGALF
jgi:hypothetical protein